MADDERQSSNTAVGVAMLRAVHQLIDGTPKILDDTVIVPLLGPSAVEYINAHLEQLQSPRARGLRSHVVLRSRFAEDRLEHAVSRGIKQYILLGAGLDTFAYRQPPWSRALHVIEVDHPASQAAKRERLAAAGISVPDNVSYAAIDFEHEALADGLRRCGVRDDVPTFFSWLGVMVYLSEDAVDAVLQTAARFPSPSQIAFTFTQPREPREPGGDDAPSLAERAAAAGEPWITYYAPAALEQKLYRLGFSSVVFLTPDESAARYFANRSDRLPVPRRTAMGIAESRGGRGEGRELPSSQM